MAEMFDDHPVEWYIIRQYGLKPMADLDKGWFRA